MRPHKPQFYIGDFVKSNRGTYFEGRQWAMCWCRLSHNAKVHRLARVRKAKVSP